MDTRTYGWPTDCEDVEQLLKTVTEEINDFEAKQLGKLKGELEVFEKKKQTVADAYEQRHPALKAKWCALTAELETLHRTLVCLFKDAWKTQVTTCVCPRLEKVAVAAAAVDKRATCALGPLELARNQAVAKTDRNKAYLDTLIGNQAALEKELAAVEKWIGDIKTLLQGKEAGKAIHILWFKALVTQRAIASDALLACLKFADGEEPCDLCPPTTREGKTADTVPVPMTPHPVPWLVDPEKLTAEIDCAWTAYRRAKDDQGKAEVAFKIAPDDLATTTRALEDLRKKLDEEIANCLKGASPHKPCADDAKPPVEPKDPDERPTDPNDPTCQKPETPTSPCGGGAPAGSDPATRLQES